MGRNKGRCGARLHRSRLINHLRSSTAVLCFVAALTVTPTSLATAETFSLKDVERQSHHFNIEVTQLGQALTRFADVAGLRLLFRSDLVTGLSTERLSGEFTNDEALTKLLSGTGLSHRFNDENTVTIVDPYAAAYEAISTNDSDLEGNITELDKITVTGAAFDETKIYRTDGSVAVISEETIDRFRGYDPADIFRGTPGVMSGEARNSAGAIDVNIRGMQGLGRVAVTVDGASNSLSIYQGYQGISNRTFVDPDLLAGIDITKGTDLASNGIAGTVAMQTISADDIVMDGKKFGVRIKTGFGTNTSSPPPAGTVGGYAWPSDQDPQSVLVPSQSGLDRPDLLEPTNGSASAALGFKSEPVDLVAGFAYRKRGNYYAGSNNANKKAAEAKGTGVVRQYCPSPFGFWGCDPFLAPLFGIPYTPLADGTELVNNHGQTNYRAGEEVLNTQLETMSFLGKGTFRIGDDHTVKLGYNGYRSEAGDVLSSRLVNNESQPVQRPNTTGTKVDSGIAEYQWQPDSALIDLNSRLWGTSLRQQNQRYFHSLGFAPEYFGLPVNFRNGTETLMWGAEVSNASEFATRFGTLDLELGVSYQREETEPDKDTNILLERAADQGIHSVYLKPRNGVRQETAGYSKLAWSPLDWMTIKTGLKYQHYWSEDRDEDTPNEDRSKGGFSHSLGLTVSPFDSVQLYGQYSSALRLPSLFETVTVGAVQNQDFLDPERSNNWEIGANYNVSNLLWDEDRFMMKLGYFDWTVKDYIAREWVSAVPSYMRMFNMPKAHFSGIELASRYELSGFTAELAANYYTDVTFCRTADTCGGKSLYGDYSTNQVPPKYSVNVTLSQRFLDDALTIGARVSHTGPRAIEHGDATGVGAQEFISLIDWSEYTLFDAFAEYKLNDNLSFSLRAENLTDEFYVDPLGLVNQPAPGRTIFGSLTVRF
ncbi:MAG: TonB-dependent receptor [Pseudomonadota bacterium]